MNEQIFLSTKNFIFTENDRKASIKIDQMIKEARFNMPNQFYSVYNLLHSNEARKTRLFRLMKTIPKGCMHHLHLDCTEDEQFYQKHVISDPLVYLTEDHKQFRIGTKKQAKQNKWQQMGQAAKNYKSQNQFVSAISNITMFNQVEMKTYAGHQKQIWDAFQIKIVNFFNIYLSLHLFKKYIRHVFEKYANNGYDRIQFRAMLVQLIEYDEQGNKIKTHDQKKFMDIVDQVYEQVKLKYPSLTVGFIFFGLKVFSDQLNDTVFTKVCELNWDKTIGLDFVQQQDLFGDLQSYDKVVDRVLARYPHLNYKKVYHAGQTRDHLTRNVEISIKAGSVRIGHGLNILQRPQYLAFCKNICFELNPVSNLILGYQTDTRLSPAPVLLGLGYPVTINPDDPGKFGLEDNSMDYFVAACSYHWHLKHLKLIAIHSINHAICSEKDRFQLLKSFNNRWDKWVVNLIKEDQILVDPFIQDLAIFQNVKNWSFSDKQMQAQRKFTDLIEQTRNNLPKDFYHSQKFLSYLKEMKGTILFGLLKTIPKSVLQHNHFQSNQDFDFYKKSIVNDPNLYLNKQRTQFCYGTQQQAAQKEWVSLKIIQSQFSTSDEFINQIASLTIFTQQQSNKLAGKQELIWSKFQAKIAAFQPIVKNLAFFRQYVKHVFIKFINNGYDRIQLRAKIQKLNEYNQDGKLVKAHQYKKFIEVVDQVFKQVIKDYPHFTVGFIFVGLKASADQQNEKMFDQICQLEWKKTIGFDFVQEEQLYGCLEKYNSVVDRVLKKYPHLDYKKVYHAGQSKDQLNKNLQTAIKAGSTRIGDGINALQRIQYLTHYKNICFQKNPTTNLILGYTGDSRSGSAPTLLGLGFPVTINADDPGKFGLEDATSDYFIAAVSYKWRLRHFKLIALNALNHSICPIGQKLILEEIFEQKWRNWIQEFIKVNIY